MPTMRTAPYSLPFVELCSTNPPTQTSDCHGGRWRQGICFAPIDRVARFFLPNTGTLFASVASKEPAGRPHQEARRHPASEPERRVDLANVTARSLWATWDE